MGIPNTIIKTTNENFNDISNFIICDKWFVLTKIVNSFNIRCWFKRFCYEFRRNERNN
jgi:hypothetical protein